MLDLLAKLFSAFTNRSAYLVAIYAGLYAIFNYTLGVIQRLETAIASLDEVITPTFDGTLNISPFSLLNYVLPLDLAIVLFTGWLAFHLVCVGIRMVKAWIPTVS